MKGPAQQPQGFLGNAAPKRFSSFGAPPAGGFGAPAPAVAGTGAALTGPTQGWMNKPNVGTWTPGAGQPPWAGNNWGRSTDADPLARALTTGRTGSWKANGEWSPSDNAEPAAAAAGAMPTTPLTTGTGATPAAAAAAPTAPSFGDPAMQAQYTNEQLWGQGLGKRPTYTPPPAPTSQLDGFSRPYTPAAPPPYGTGYVTPSSSASTPQTNTQSQYSDLIAAIPQAAPAINQMLGNPQDLQQYIASKTGGQDPQMLQQYIDANTGGKMSPDIYAQLKAALGGNFP